ncbi:hypothetical protein KKF91_05040 [Myxococcota bacterium]|nr:hypothetical protein [Myxococcota bacterium]
MKRYTLLALALLWALGCDDDGGSATVDDGGAGQGGAPSEAGQGGQAGVSGEAGQGEAGQGEAGQGEAGQGEAGQGEAGQGEAGQGEAGQGEAGQGGEAGAPVGPGGGEVPPEIEAPEGVEAIEFIGVQITNGQSELFEIELPEDVLSVTMIVLGDERHMVTIEHFEGPDGQILVSANPPGVTINDFDRMFTPFPGPFKSPNRVAVASMAVGTMLAPNNPEVAVGPGPWTYRLAALNATSGAPGNLAVDLTVLIRRGPEPTGGLLDVHLHFTGAHGWTAANAPTDEDFQVALARMRAFYAEIGVRLGEITYDDIPEAFQTADIGAEPGSVLHQIYALNRYSSGVGLFFVERINSPFGAGSIGGIAGGTPGPSLIPNTPRSGVVIATEADPDPRAIGHIMGHETGHFLGLYHTSEMMMQDTHDQIPDTPQGDASNTNLMYPTVTAGDAHLSEGQGWVMKRNANMIPVEE